ncbi:MAG: hypothetical protein JJU11_14550 [Candidatus Sumerlaeia bacterium]|nr:hypothetical protein [Candidatus Sumerlaeia bacterium]
MKKQIFSLAMVAALVTTASAQILIDGAENTDYTINVASGDSITLANVSDSTQGSSSLEVTYNHEASSEWLKDAIIEKVLDTPLDLTSAEVFKYDIKVIDENPSLLMVIQFVDDNGYVFRYLDYGALTNASTDWDTRELRFSEIQKSRWVAQGRAANLRSIARVRYNILNPGEVENGTTVFQLDNLRIGSESGLLNETVINDFETYTDSAAAAAAWPQRFGAGTTAAISTDSLHGSQSLEVSAEVTGRWISFAVENELPAPMDFSEAAYVKLSVRGNSTMAGLNPASKFWLVDGNGRRALGYGFTWPQIDDWSVIIMPFQTDGVEPLNADGSPAWGGNSPWREDRWDGRAAPYNDNTDLTNITRIIVGFETNNEPDPNPYPLGVVDVLFDDIVVGFESALPSEAPTSAEDWLMYN